jgi:hypothetical protein
MTPGLALLVNMQKNHLRILERQQRECKRCCVYIGVPEVSEAGKGVRKERAREKGDAAQGRCPHANLPEAEVAVESTEGGRDSSLRSE